jgi:hypothetical protein
MARILKCPIEHVQIAMDAANVTQGCILNYNIGPIPALVKVTGYVVTQPTSGTTFDVGHSQTTKTKAHEFVDGVTNITGTIFGPGCTLATVGVLCAANDYVTAFNLATDTNTLATALVGYFDLEIIRYPVLVGDQ